MQDSRNIILKLPETTVILPSFEGCLFAEETRDNKIIQTCHQAEGWSVCIEVEIGQFPQTFALMVSRDEFVLRCQDAPPALCLEILERFAELKVLSKVEH